MEEIAVSVICNAYNHEKYIKDALDGFVMQETDFKFEVLVHDDASTDGTADIIREYEKKYPDLIKPIYQTENQYSKGGGRVGQIQRKRVKGKYVALCEGDDYWTDPYKLQKQYNAMEKQPKMMMCAHAANMIDAKTGEVIKQIAPEMESCVLSMARIIAGGGGFVATNSLFYRAELNNTNMEFRKIYNIDYSLQILGTYMGEGMLYLSDNMSVYRWLADGCWTVRQRADVNQQIQTAETTIQMLNMFDKETNYKYTEAVKKRLLKHESDILICKEDYKGALSKRYLEYNKKLGLKNYLKLCVYAYVPYARRLVKHLTGVLK